jgi:hypothetical protein
VKRWLVVAAAVLLAAGAFAVLVQREPSPGGPPLDDIDDASRARLEEVLREEGER